MQNSKNDSRHRGRAGQISIYLGKLFRMFVFVNDWKLLPMAAIIAGLVAKVAATNMFLTQEGTIFGSLALACICIWNGCFNSIQVVCREREVVKREHRDGMHISSYICAHVIYQGFLCLCQTIITIAVCKFAGLSFPKSGILFPNFYIDFGITLFLITFSSDMLALMLSSIVRNTTSAMTVMPFVLIFELLFSGSMFELSETAQKITNISVAKWGINALGSLARYNELPMVTIWNKLKTFSNIEVYGVKPVDEAIKYLNDSGNASKLTYWMGAHNQNANYESSISNLGLCWSFLAIFAVLFVVIAIICLERIDHDKR